MSARPKPLPHAIAHPSIEPWSDLDRSWRSVTSTPLHEFVTILRWAKDRHLLFELTARDTFQPALARKVFAAVEAEEEAAAATKLVTTLPARVKPFDRVAVLGPDVVEILPSDPNIRAMTRVVFPVFASELSESASVYSVRTRRRDLLPGAIVALRYRQISAIDWKRSPSPEIWLKAVGHTGDFKLATADQVREAIGEVVGTTRTVTIRVASGSTLTIAGRGNGTKDVLVDGKARSKKTATSAAEMLFAVRPPRS